MVESVPRQPADIRISRKKRSGPTHRIEFVRQPVGRRYWVRQDSKYSIKAPEATASQTAERIRRCLVADSQSHMAAPEDLGLSGQTSYRAARQRGAGQFQKRSFFDTYEIHTSR